MGDEPDVGSLQVVEFRRYTLKANEREHFSSYFDTYFPEAMQQLGAETVGSFVERDHPLMFTWLRAYREMDDRAKSNAAFYYGPVWKEHKPAVNGLIVDSDNVLLLRPVSDKHGVMLLPAVDPVNERDGARGVAVALLFKVQRERLDTFIARAEVQLSRVASESIREAAFLVTLDEKNNFPQLPIRTDGPFVVWIGIARDDEAIARIDADAFDIKPEVIVLDPTKRSRLRWR